MRTCEMPKQINQEKFEKWLLDNIEYEAQRYNASVDQRKKSLPKKTIDTAKVMAKIEKLKDLYINDLLPKDIYERDYKALSALLSDD